MTDLIASEGVFHIDPDPADLAERQADRVARHQQAEAFRAGWSGDNWLWCGGCHVPAFPFRGSCSKATCTGHRLCGEAYSP